MTDLSNPPSVALPPRTHLPVSSYFDPAWHAREMATLRAACPTFLATAPAVPGPGDYLALPQEGEGRVLVNTGAGLELLSNVCRHRQAIMLRGRGNTGGSIVCPLHRWTYDNHGKLIGAPHFDTDPCRHLPAAALQTWNGLVFEDHARKLADELAGMGPARELDLAGWVLGKVEAHECRYNWKTFIEVYLEDYHVRPFHPGLGNFVTCDDLRWEFGAHHSVQTVGLAAPGGQPLGRAGSEVYRRWQDALLQYQAQSHGGTPPAHGATWLTLYPFVMVEWYPNVLVVSTLHPQGPERTLNLVAFHYPEEIAAFEPEFMAAQQAAYMETAIEDDEIAERMDAGRKALMLRGEDDFGPYQSPMEDGMPHFHRWYRGVMGMD